MGDDSCKSHICIYICMGNESRQGSEVWLTGLVPAAYRLARRFLAVKAIKSRDGNAHGKVGLFPHGSQIFDEIDHVGFVPLEGHIHPSPLLCFAFVFILTKFLLEIRNMQSVDLWKLIKCVHTLASIRPRL